MVGEQYKSSRDESWQWQVGLRESADERKKNDFHACDPCGPLAVLAGGLWF